MPRPDVRVDTNGINQILRRLPGNRDALVRRIAFEVEAEAKQLAPVDTGALKASIYTRTSNEQMPDVDEGERVELPRPPEGVAHVGPSVEYGVYQELGTSDMAAQPYLTPAVEMVRTRLHQFADDLRGLAEGRDIGD